MLPVCLKSILEDKENSFYATFKLRSVPGGVINLNMHLSLLDRKSMGGIKILISLIARRLIKCWKNWPTCGTENDIRYMKNLLSSVPRRPCTKVSYSVDAIGSVPYTGPLNQRQKHTRFRVHLKSPYEVIVNKELLLYSILINLFKVIVDNYQLIVEMVLLE